MPPPTSAVSVAVATGCQATCGAAPSCGFHFHNLSDHWLMSQNGTRTSRRGESFFQRLGESERRAEPSRSFGTWCLQNQLRGKVTRVHLLEYFQKVVILPSFLSFPSLTSYLGWSPIRRSTGGTQSFTNLQTRSDLFLDQISRCRSDPAPFLFDLLDFTQELMLQKGSLLSLWCRSSNVPACTSAGHGEGGPRNGPRCWNH